VKTVLAILLYTLSLFGIDVGSKMRVDRIQDNGTDVLYSEVVAQPTGTRFECLRSASGQCYYTVFPEQCTTPTGRPAADCLSRPAQRFALAMGDSRRVPSMPSLSMCVSADAKLRGPGCE
jgi:hypothetical protein